MMHTWMYGCTSYILRGGLWFSVRHDYSELLGEYWVTAICDATIRHNGVVGMEAGDSHVDLIENVIRQVPKWKRR